ncbi:hypothetical protein PPYR_13987 [Photinus pyralis]|uniref:Uncharacterized protein n=1 Tax=Photinus pyralis TaxID=7054 RepID=A0A1Y1LDE9_PHOPY|nr:heparan-alpha-glucosaminide N-acetyltransferase-like [Photinus pyralis]KAB0792026.1 hypothetical protein PPYR_13987 [Photinus pyralis]
MLFEKPHKCNSSTADLIFDEACLDISNHLQESIRISGQYNECDGCEFETLAVIDGKTNTSILVNTRYSLHVNYTYNNVTCEHDKLFYEHYRYGWNLTENCSRIEIKEQADSAYLPILTAFIVLFAFGTLWYMVKCVYKCTKNNDIWNKYIFRYARTENDQGSPLDGSSLVIERPPTIRKHPHRIKSLDVFRGLCISIMIFVNYGGGRYWFFRHSVWNGLTVADLVFPWFVWIMGLSLTVSLGNRLRRAVPRRQLFMSVVQRSLLLIFIGIILNSNDIRTQTLASLRFPGVLQRLGLTYLIVGVIEVAFAKRTTTVNEFGRLAFLEDILIAIPQWIVMLTFILIHTLITFLVEVPGCGRGYMGPGGLHDLGHHVNCTGGAAGYIDRLVFGAHMYSRPTCRVLYETTLNYDPEGILGTLTACFLMYLGVQAGHILLTYSNVNTRIIRWNIWGCVMGLIGGALCGFSKNGGLIPINKNLWSLSFVLVVGGLAFLIQAYLFLLVDIMRKWGGRPLFYPGMNSLILYIGHVLLKGTFPFAWLPTSQTHGAYLYMNLWSMALWVAISIYLYKRNTFFSI